MVAVTERIHLAAPLNRSGLVGGRAENPRWARGPWSSHVISVLYIYDQLVNYALRVIIDLVDELRLCERVAGHLPPYFGAIGEDRRADAI